MVIRHLRSVANQYGASAVTQLRYVPSPSDTTGIGARAGSLSAIIVQEAQETPNGPVRTPPMDPHQPCREEGRYSVPGPVNGQAVMYDILIERYLTP